MMWRAPSSNLLGLPHNANYTLIEWGGPGRVIFSYCKRGDAAINMHFAADKVGLRYLRGAFRDFVELIQEQCPWCDMLLSIGAKGGVERFIKRLGFEFIATSTDGLNGYARFI